MKIPPWCRFTIRATGEFTVKDKRGHILGPDMATARRFTIETAGDPLEIKVHHAESVEISSLAEVRPSPYEHNSGVPVEISAEVSQPTIQEMMRLYLADYRDRIEPDEPETPDEFFDFGDDDDDDLVFSQYQYDEMPEEPLSEPDSQESGALLEEPEPTPAPQTQETQETKPE